MNAIVRELLVLVVGLSVVGGAVQAQEPATPAERFKTLFKEFYGQTHVFSIKAKTDDERNQAATGVANLRLKCLVSAVASEPAPYQVLYSERVRQRLLG